MNPASYPAEHVALQGRNDGYPGHPGHPGGPTVVQYTTVNFASEAPRDHVIWSIFNFIHVNPCCLGLVALVYSIKGKNDGYPGHPGNPGGSTVVQYTTVNIASEAPSDHVIWSIFNFIHVNPCCLGLVALVYSIKARDRKMAGDMAGARSYGSTARCVNIWATVLVCLTVLIFFIVLIVKIKQVIDAISIQNNYRPNDGYNPYG